jgi:hypothetical protein
LHTQLKKDVANDYSKGSTDAYPINIHKALTLMNEYKPLKVDAPTLPAQGTAFVTGGRRRIRRVWIRVLSLKSTSKHPSGMS